MEAFLIYSLKSASCLAALYIFFWLLLKRDTFFAMNRVFLIISIMASIVFPAIVFNSGISALGADYKYILKAITIQPDITVSSGASAITILAVLFWLYISVSAFFLLRFILQVAGIIRIVRQSSVSVINGKRIWFNNNQYPPFSFFGLMVAPSGLDEDALRKIISHEKVHIRQLHTLDNIIAELLVAFQWFNPAAWLCRRSLKELHEYQADAGVLSEGCEKSYYQRLLLSIAFGTYSPALSNGFNRSLIRSRIQMMLKEKSRAWTQLKYLFILPVSVILLIILSFSGNPAFRQTGSYNAGYQARDSKVSFTEANIVPEFIGGTEALYKYIVANVKYPEAAKAKGISGKVIVRITVSPSGKVTNPALTQTVHPALDAEALRVVSMLPDWKPGSFEGKPVTTTISIPINFTLK